MLSGFWRGIKECMDFMFEQSQVQNYLLQQLPVPYALLDGNGMIIWSNDAFYKIVGEKDVYKRQPLASPEPKRGQLASKR